MSTNSRFGGVSECYAFKSRLQEYAQKVGFTTPVYHTVMEGPPHEPIFRSTVVMNNISYESLPGFYNRKTAEQSAAEVALMELHQSGQMTECIPMLHETGLCKNLLQEYAQKMNLAVPLYKCKKLLSDENPYCCTVEIDGVRYIGAAAKTKKEAEIKVARTALLALKSSGTCKGVKENNVSTYVVLPGKRKANDSEAPAKVAKPMKSRTNKFKKNGSKKDFIRRKWGDRSKFRRNQQIENAVHNAGGTNNELADVDKRSAAATTEGLNLQRNAYESGRRDEHPGNVSQPSRMAVAAVDATLQDGLAEEPHRARCTDENFCLSRPPMAPDGCGDRQVMLVPQLAGVEFDSCIPWLKNNM